MKKYKLIKKYPGSPEVGEIVQGNGREGWYTKGPGCRTYDWTQIVYYPEYWEEVVEIAKDYEIVAIKTREETIIEYSNGKCTKRNDGYSVEITYDLHEVLQRTESPSTIYSVKRLSDGEVFTVGDLIKTPYTDCTPIIGFNTKYSTEYFIEVPTGFTRLLSLEKVKNPIFLTHDGKDIFAGDTVWWVRKDSTSVTGRLIIPPGEKFNSDMTAYFLTEEAASDYIAKNKVIFTTEDGVGIKRGDTYYFVDTDFSINLSNAHPGCGQYSERKYFSTFETAQYYVIVNAKVLSIEEFWEFVSKPGSNVVKQKALKRLVKQRLKIE